MNDTTALDICRTDLFTAESELRQRFPTPLVDKVIRIRMLYNWYLSNPSGSDSNAVAQVVQAYGCHKTTAYKDLQVVKALLPMLATASRDFHRWRTNEMLKATYDKAEAKGDTKTMERVATSYGRLNQIDKEDEQAMPYDKIATQPFVPTMDPRVLGIEPIPNIDKKIREMIGKYRKETLDIEDVSWEEADLNLDVLFPDQLPAPTDTSADGTETNIL